MWRYKFATLPILAFVLVGAFYVIAIKTPVYEAGSTYILVNPPAPPTESDIARDPSLGRLGLGQSLHPLLRPVRGRAGARRAAEQRRGQRRRSRGGGPIRTTPLPRARSSGTARRSCRSAVPGRARPQRCGPPTSSARRSRQELDRMQAAQRVSPRYRIVTQQVVAPHDAKLKASGKLRALVAVFALGAGSPLHRPLRGRRPRRAAEGARPRPHRRWPGLPDRGGSPDRAARAGGR